MRQVYRVGLVCGVSQAIIKKLDFELVFLEPYFFTLTLVGKYFRCIRPYYLIP